MAYPLRIACQEGTSCVMFWVSGPEPTGGSITSDELVYRHRLDIFKDYSEDGPAKVWSIPFNACIYVFVSPPPSPLDPLSRRERGPVQTPGMGLPLARTERGTGPPVPRSGIWGTEGGQGGEGTFRSCARHHIEQRTFCRIIL